MPLFEPLQSRVSQPLDLSSLAMQVEKLAPVGSELCLQVYIRSTSTAYYAIQLSSVVVTTAWAVAKALSACSLFSAVCTTDFIQEHSAYDCNMGPWFLRVTLPWNTRYKATRQQHFQMDQSLQALLIWRVK